MGTAHNGILNSPSIHDIRLGPYITQLIQKIVGSWTKYIAIDILPKNYTYNYKATIKIDKKNLRKLCKLACKGFVLKNLLKIDFPPSKHRPTIIIS